MGGTRVKEALKIRGLNSRIGNQFSVIVANRLAIGRGNVQTKRMTHLVLQMWFKPMILALKQIYCVLHPASAQMCGLLSLIVFIA